jgi:hypothetical protein
MSGHEASDRARNGTAPLPRRRSISLACTKRALDKITLSPVSALTDGGSARVEPVAGTHRLAELSAHAWGSWGDASAR